jgi:hypothetical protein
MAVANTPAYYDTATITAESRKNNSTVLTFIKSKFSILKILIGAFFIHIFN